MIPATEEYYERLNSIYDKFKGINCEPITLIESDMIMEIIERC